VLIAALAMFGIYESNVHTTFAEIQPVCIDNVTLIPLERCEINFPTIKEAILYLENKMGIAKNDIYSDTDYGFIKETLHNYCPQEAIHDADQDIQKENENITSLLSG
jgi:hypothetical protein